MTLMDEGYVNFLMPKFFVYMEQQKPAGVARWKKATLPKAHTRSFPKSDTFI